VVKASAGDLLLAWDAPAANDSVGAVQFYLIEKSLISNGGFCEEFVTVGRVDGQCLSILVSNSFEHIYRVRAGNRSGFSLPVTIKPPVATDKLEKSANCLFASVSSRVEMPAARLQVSGVVVGRQTFL
jgi:hypothetical protein